MNKPLNIEEARQLEELLDRAVAASQISIGNGTTSDVVRRGQCFGLCAVGEVEVEVIEQPCTDTGNEVEMDINLSESFVGRLTSAKPRYLAI